jgi:hypothetical protein
MKLLSKNLQPRRPCRVTLLALGVLVLACLNLTRAILAVRDWDFLTQRAEVSPLYLLISGVIWTIAGMRVWFGLWWIKRWSAGFTRGLALVFSLYTWLERLFLFDRPAKALVFQPILPANWIFLAGLNILLLTWVFWSTDKSKERLASEVPHE